MTREDTRTHTRARNYSLLAVICIWTADKNKKSYKAIKQWVTWQLVLSVLYPRLPHRRTKVTPDGGGVLKQHMGAQADHTAYTGGTFARTVPELNHRECWLDVDGKNRSSKLMTRAAELRLCLNNEATSYPSLIIHMFVKSWHTSGHLELL